MIPAAMETLSETRSAGRAGTRQLLVGRGELTRALAFATVPLVCLGLSRFAYALVLPTMRASYGWSYAQSGSLNTANALGYLAGALALRPLTRGRRPLDVLRLAMLASVAALACHAAPIGYLGFMLVRFLGAGVNAMAFIAGAALVAQRDPRLLGGYTAGAGVGILISAPLMLSAPAHWRLAWLAAAAVSALALGWSWRTMGQEADPTIADGMPPVEAVRPWSSLALVLAAYAAFGTGYSGFITYAFAYIRGLGPGSTGAAFWVALGLAATVAPPLLVGGGSRGSGSLRSCLAWVTAGAVLLAATHSAALLIVAGLTFGTGFLCVPAAVIARCRRVGPDRLQAAVSVATATFAAGQAVGPLLVGAAADLLHSLGAGVWIPPLLLAGATVLAWNE